MCMIDDGEGMCDVWRQKQIKATRKTHKCTECGREIGRKEPCRYIYCVYEGKADQAYICQHCDVACRWLDDNCGGFLYHGVYEDIEGHVENPGGIQQLGLQRVLYGMRRKWRRRDRAGLMPLPIAPANYPEVTTQKAVK